MIKPSPKDDPLFPKLKTADYPGDWVWSYEPLAPSLPKPKPGLPKVLIPPAAPSK